MEFNLGFVRRVEMRSKKKKENNAEELDLFRVWIQKMRIKRCIYIYIY